MNMESNYMKYRGKCKEMSELLINENPNLTLVRGYYWCPISNREEQHWWCKDNDNNIIDPTKLQFLSAGNGQYTEYNGEVYCEYCGKSVKEEDAYFVEQHVYCSYTHYGRDIGF